MRPVRFLKKHSELSEIIMEINDLREISLGPDRPKQNRRRFNFSPLAADPVIPDFKERVPKRLNGKQYTTRLWDCKYILFAQKTLSLLSGDALRIRDFFCPAWSGRVRSMEKEGYDFGPPHLLKV